jgi:hypothetical protein
MAQAAAGKRAASARTRDGRRWRLFKWLTALAATHDARTGGPGHRGGRTRDRLARGRGPAAGARGVPHGGTRVPRQAGSGGMQHRDVRPQDARPAWGTSTPRGGGAPRGSARGRALRVLAGATSPALNYLPLFDCEYLQNFELKSTNRK